MGKNLIRYFLLFITTLVFPTYVLNHIYCDLRAEHVALMAYFIDNTILQLLRSMVSRWLLRAKQAY